MSACGACQGQIYLSWSVWSANCPTVYLSSYPEPIPSGVFVPGWAYLDVQADDTFDQLLARRNANLPDLTQSTVVPSPTAIASRSQQPTTISSTSSTPLARSTSASTSPSIGTLDARANAVGRGVVGGLLGIFVLYGFLYGYFQWKKRLSRNGDLVSSRTATENAASGQVEEEPSSSMTQARVTNPSFNYFISTPSRSTSNSSTSGSVGSLT